MSKQIYIDSNGNEVLVSGTITNDNNLPHFTGTPTAGSTAEAIKELKTPTPLSITRIENSLADATSIGRLVAYKMGGIYVLHCNLSITAGQTTSDFVEIASISGWNATCDILASLVCQNSSFGMITVQVTTSGKIKVYSPSTTLGGFYRGDFTMV